MIVNWGKEKTHYYRNKLIYSLLNFKNEHAILIKNKAMNKRSSFSLRFEEKRMFGGSP